MRFRLLPALLGSALFCAAAHADDMDLPSVNILPCVQSCANSTPAKRLNSAQAGFPSKYMADYVEAFVEIRYTVDTQGAVHDVVVVRLIGPQDFARAVVARAQSSRFEPAMLNGKPIEESRSLVDIFRIEGFPQGARSSTVSSYGQAAELLKDGKDDDAAALLEKSLAQPELNFYERGMLSMLMASIAEKRKDFLEVRDLVNVPTTYFPSELPSQALQFLLKFRIEAALNTGDMGEALKALAQLRGIKGFDAKDPIVTLVENTRTKLDASDIIPVDAAIPDAGKGDDFSFPLYRRDFGFQNVAGLDKVVVGCRQGRVESKISDKAQWHIPPDWDQCYLFVSGVPGTRFQILEFSPRVAEPVPPH